MTIDGAVVPGLLFLLAELVALAAIGYVIVRVALRETDDRVALAQGLVVGPAIWGIVVNLIMYALPGRAGAVAGWIFVLALAAVLIWRAPKPVRPRLRAAAGFALAALALFWATLANRQLLTIPDAALHLGMAASIREGGFPPEIPWHPGAPASYHYGVDLLTGLLAPPIGPDLAFTAELLGAYAWICLALVVVTALLRRTPTFAVLIAAPLLLTAGAWTLDSRPDSILAAAVPTGIPAVGLRASLMEIYWPSAELPLVSNYDALPNIWKPSFTLSYALAFVVLARAAHAGRRSWLSVMTLAGLVGFAGLLATSLAPMLFVLWTGMEAIYLVQSRRAGFTHRSDVIRSALGVVLAALLLVVASGWLTRILTDSVVVQGLSLGWNERLGGWRLLGTLDRSLGGIGLVGLGPIAVASLAVLLARRDRVVLALAAGTGALLLTALPLNYEPASWDLTRIEGHARNFALMALLLALSSRLAALRSQWRYVASVLIVALITLPTIAGTVRNLVLAASNGVEVANAPAGLQWSEGRFSVDGGPSDRVAAYIQNHTAIDARVFSPTPYHMTFATGRSNASGLVGHLHQQDFTGPEHRDVLRFLEPAAVRRLGIGYVHAPDSWVEGLPDEAVERLYDPTLFELLVRDTSESLYRVLPALLSLDPPPAPGSYEALRRAVPASATVFLPEAFESRGLIRTGQALPHARLLGAIHTKLLHLRTSWRVEPLSEHVPNLMVTPLEFVPWMFPPASRQPIWWNDETAVYALDGAVDQIMPPPPWTEPLPFGVRVSDVRTADGGRIAFTATFDDRAPNRWMGQDWLIIARDNSRYGLPTQILSDGRLPATTMWFSGQIWPGPGTTSLAYEIDFLAPSMAFRRSGGALTPAGTSEAEFGPGLYALAVRLRHEYKPGYWRDAAIIPVLRITVSETGEVSYQVHEDAGG